MSISTNNKILTVNNVSKVYQRKNQPEPLTALDDVSLYINENETYGLVGESGSGKSTLGKIIVSLIRPSSGVIEYAGRDLITDVAHDMALRRQIQMVFQDPQSSLNPRLTVHSILDESLIIQTNLNKVERNEAINNMIVKVGLTSRQLQQYPHTLSGGQSQRVAIARALIVRPKLIVLDEAVSALDVSIQFKVLQLLNDVQDEFGISYLFISHDLRVVRELCDRVGILNNGVLVEENETERIFEEGQHPYTQKLTSSIPQLKYL